jgi:hypothetical protein
MAVDEGLVKNIVYGAAGVAAVLVLYILYKAIQMRMRLRIADGIPEAVPVMDSKLSSNSAGGKCNGPPASYINLIVQKDNNITR